jgi:arylsulfatase A-like enzyme
MDMRRFSVIALVLSATCAIARAEQPNLILFVSDGLRGAAVMPETAPNMSRLRRQGVEFRNSHSVFVTVTTANASVIATGHFQGDTGDFGNSIFSGQPVAAAGGSLTPFIQDNPTIGELNGRHGGSFINERTLMAAARERGYQTAVLGKAGPVAIQDITALDGASTLFFDDQTGGNKGIALRPDILDAMKAAGLPTQTPGRGSSSDPGKTTNSAQQLYYREIVTKVLLPKFKAAGKPFMIVFWSTEPDTTQHGQTDSINELTPGINGPTSLAAIKLADDDLGAILSTLHEQGLDASTNVLITSDHGFSTVSKQSTTSATTRLSFPNVPQGQLPPGFLGIDLSMALDLPLRQPSGKFDEIDYRNGKYPDRANVILGRDPARPDIVIAANGADLIYLPQPNAKELAPRIVKTLLAQDYVSGIFVHDSLGAMPGTLPLSSINLRGAALTPTPSIVVNMRSYTTGCDRPLYCAVLVSDVPFKQGQGMHGSFSRADTANFMAAAGPSFRRRYVDPAPVSNADIAPTLARLIGVELPAKGSLVGRVMTEALRGGKSVRYFRRNRVSKPSENGLRTIVNLQFVGKTPYFDAAGFAGRTVGLRVPPDRVSSAAR